jgi:predicted RNase H-related nuclease YkuK (DUF458 family)
MNIFKKLKGWKSGRGENYSINEIFAKIKSLQPIEVHIGSDSQVIKKNITYVTAICLVWPGNGGVYFIKKSKTPKKNHNNLQSRLFEEVHRSIDIANKVKNETGKDIMVHIDVSQQMIHKSSKYAKALSNYVLAMGYDYLLKPNSWASGSVADRHTK